MPNWTTPEGLAKLKALHEAATPGEWEIRGTSEICVFGLNWACVAGAHNPRPADRPNDPLARAEPADIRNPRFDEACANAELIAAARNALPSLIAEIERLRKALAWMHQHGGALYRDTSSEWNYEPAGGPLPGVGATPLDAIESSINLANASETA